MVDISGTESPLTAVGYSSVRPEGAGHRAAHNSSTDDRRRKAVVSEETRQAMTRKRSGKAIPKFSSDRAAAEFWSANDSAAYAAHLEEARVTVNPRLRRRIAERAAQKKAITLRLETQQIERAKLVAQRKSIPYQTLMRMWIAEGLAKEGVKTA
jgi:predicted DNA binding CopG/RHH family protein